MDSLKTVIEKEQKKFVFSCDQLRRVGTEIESLQTRIDRAEKNRKSTDILLLKLATLEAVRHYLHQYVIKLDEYMEDLEAKVDE